MKWNTLINNTRLGCESHQNQDNRNSYQRDYDRIVFSKEFRLLQSKTQVVPFPEKDTTHTRLTHSLETASVGRSLGVTAAERLNLNNLGISNEDVGYAVSAACLAHDIGNPPLGHSGENAISHYFLSEQGSKILDKHVTENQRFDFERLEGNAIGFNILTSSDPRKTQNTGGFGLTYTTLAAFTKYPNRLRNLSEEQSNKSFLKKPGLLNCDIQTFESIAEKLEMKKLGENHWCRHPLAFLTEAADDICYAIVDLEDGYRNNCISFKETSDLLCNIIDNDSDTILNLEVIKNKDEIIGYLRAKAINAMINMSVNVFCNKITDILNGEFNSTLIKSLPDEARSAYNKIKVAEVEHIYKEKNVLLTEAAGFIVLPGLLDILVTAAFEKSSRSDKIKECLIKEMICDNTSLDEETRNYTTILNIVKFVALMTDNYAVKLYRELTGIQLPNY